MHKIDHVGIAVTDIEAAIKTYEGLGFTLKGRDRVDSQKVETAFFQIGESCIELIAATPHPPHRTGTADCLTPAVRRRPLLGCLALGYLDG